MGVSILAFISNFILFVLTSMAFCCSGGHKNKLIPLEDNNKVTPSPQQPSAPVQPQQYVTMMPNQQQQQFLQPIYFQQPQQQPMVSYAIASAPPQQLILTPQTLTAVNQQPVIAAVA